MNQQDNKEEYKEKTNLLLFTLLAMFLSGMWTLFMVYIEGSLEYVAFIWIDTVLLVLSYATIRIIIYERRRR